MMRRALHPSPRHILLGLHRGFTTAAVIPRSLPRASLLPGLGAARIATSLLAEWSWLGTTPPRRGDHQQPARTGSQHPPTDGSHKPKPKNKTGDDDDDDDDDMEDGPDITQYTRVALHLALGLTCASVVLYWLSWPSGTQTNFQHVLSTDAFLQRIQNIRVYHHYAQLSLHDGYAYIGINPQNPTETDVALEEIASRRTTMDVDHGNQHAEPVDVVYLGTSYSQQALELLAVVAWVVPFVFTPLYVTFLSQATGTAIRATLKALARSRGDDKTQTKNAAKLFKVTHRTNVRFADVAGLMEPKAEIEEIVDFLRNPDRYAKMGAKIPSGAMLLGPPGTGKTLLAKAVAGESDVAFIPCVGSDFVELYVGMGALRVRKLFELAKQQPKCIIYIDEIDAIGLKRGGGGGGEKQEQEHTLNELLTQLDGFSTNTEKIIVLASSNVDKEMLDPALIRPGRFDRMVHIDPPVMSERIEIFKYHLTKLKLLPDDVLGANDQGIPEMVGASAQATAANEHEDKQTSGERPDESDKTIAPTAALDTIAPPLKYSAAADPPPVSMLKAAQVERPVVPPAAAGRPPVSMLKAAEVGTHVVPPAAAGPPPTLLLKAAEVGTPVVPPATASVDAARTTSAIPSDDQNVSPELTTREQLVDTYARRMSDLCPGFVGADIANVCNEAAILAARLKATHVTLEHLEKSIDRVLAGIEQRSRVMSDFEKNVVAHHEAGHAVAGWFLNRADPLMKVSIVPRGGKALGYAQYLPNENMQRSADDIMDSICVTLGGRVAEAIFFNHLSTGASDDLQKVTRMAYSYVTGFNRSAAYSPPNTQYMKPFGEATGAAIDDAAKALVDRAYQKTYDLLLKHKIEMQKLAEHLLTHEMLTHADIVALLGTRPARTSERKQH